MYIVFKDTLTGQSVKTNGWGSIYWWAEGNGACDCNRAGVFPEGGYTCGDSPYRYQAIEVADSDVCTVEEAMAESNDGVFPQKHLKTKEDVLRVINNGLY